MGTVVKMQGQLSGKLTQIIVEALEAEQTHDRPVLLLAADDMQKNQILRQLQCMVGSRGTRIEVKTYEELGPRPVPDTGGTSDSSL